MFLVNKLSRMKGNTPLGSRIAEVHNGSSLFTGDAGQGESNIRRWILENDWLEAIIALPLNMFYNTGIATYIWVLTNKKPNHRKGKVQLVDATELHRPLRKNLGKKNCELTAENIQHVMEMFLNFEETETSKVFPNAHFGYRKITIERPLRLAVELSEEARASLLERVRETGSPARRPRRPCCGGARPRTTPRLQRLPHRRRKRGAAWERKADGRAPQVAQGRARGAG
jgi:type I restriction enzyme M protein